MESKILSAKYNSGDTPLRLGNLEIPCYVLEDGTRVFSGRGIQKVLGYGDKRGQWLQDFVTKSDLTPIFSSGENSVYNKITNPIKFNRNGAGGSQSTTYGYEVTILIDLCSIIIDTNRSGVFNDMVVVNNADIIIRSVAKVRIIALVDEATGYNKVKERAKDELQKFLNRFLSEEASKWVKTFNDSFFEMIYKMRGWDWKMTNKKPGVVGQWINDIVYKRLAPGVYLELQDLNPKDENGHRKEKHHQYLSNETGKPMLKGYLNTIEALGRAADYDWDVFMTLLNKAYPVQAQQYDTLLDK